MYVILYILHRVLILGSLFCAFFSLGVIITIANKKMAFDIIFLVFSIASMLLSLFGLWYALYAHKMPSPKRMQQAFLTGAADKSIKWKKRMNWATVPAIIAGGWISLNGVYWYYLCFIKTEGFTDLGTEVFAVGFMVYGLLNIFHAILMTVYAREIHLSPLDGMSFEMKQDNLPL